MKVEFKELPHQIQINIIKTLYSFDACHVEHYANGEMVVATSYALKSNYSPDEWISQEFTKKSLGIYIKRSFGYEWLDMCEGWEYMTEEEKQVMYKASEIMLNARALRILKNILN